MRDAILDMRMDTSSNLKASDIVNNYSATKLAEIFFKYGEEKLSKIIAKKITENRPIMTTFELVDAPV